MRSGNKFWRCKLKFSKCSEAKTSEKPKNHYDRDNKTKIGPKFKENLVCYRPLPIIAPKTPYEISLPALKIKWGWIFTK